MGARPSRKTLMLFSIGPVQEFIAQARKTRDLWFGSHLLSELGKAAAFKLSKLEAHVIFPYVENLEKLDAKEKEKINSPNRVMALVDTSEPKAVALEVKAAVIEKWMSYANGARRLLGRDINPALWKRQVKDLIEFHAVWMDCKEEAHYAEVRQKAEELLAARKTLRDFKPNQPSHMYGEVKSSLDPGRECVLEKHQYKRYAPYGIKKDESLDAISLVKRLSFHLSPNTRHFPSVCDVAFSQLRRKIEKDNLLTDLAKNYQEWVWNKYPKLKKRLFSDLFDSRLFYVTHIKEMVEGAYPNKNEQEQIIKLIAQKLESFYKETKLNSTPYYAFLVCDGDQMGKALRNLKNIEDHQAFSKKLSEFAAKARKIVTTDKRDEGELVYAGGDDVMAYLPLHRCLDVAAKLQQLFGELMNEALPKEAVRPTLSVGIVIAHMMEPMSEVRKLAMAAEKQAKRKRNELAIFFQKRSGGDRMRFSVSFDTEPTRNIKKILKFYYRNVMSVGIAHAIQSLHTEYSGLLQNQLVMSEERLEKLLEQEVSRLVWKKRSSGIDDETVKSFETCILGLMRKGKGSPLERLDRLVQQMMVAIQLEKAGDFTDATDSNSST
ncbi:type III-B CRISPR-associated protein Cas10/Cmr2 [Halalkalibacterium halodurans]|uniref:BH0328 protein n=1 Tax=Halalkalibacterium halodurans (strain ATCC BAA-125 / DSM 18197 / FERM 7344 / JCM 9153 / C-125) TaxID=272558 RepID=Q9KFY8_HALH5|nr:type III-B CRISPR-associated protein Cas10/Cmr2 [Halalkalibacterium halodurans]MED4172850.1 type III-B CRISPR-associated protein Cas10/Cmr2 [Halalkalibacterium halodurans]BAB04047.1 BH0328 [Halalkalibacterium halodurans C-125]